MLFESNLLALYSSQTVIYCGTGNTLPYNSLLLTYKKLVSETEKIAALTEKQGWWSSGSDADEPGQLATLCSRTASLNLREKGMMCCRRSLSPLRSEMVLCMHVLISCEPARTCSAWARWLGSRFMEWRVRAANVYRGKAHAAPISVWEKGVFVRVYAWFVCITECLCLSVFTSR